jgi:hypothetical protein
LKVEVFLRDDEVRPGIVAGTSVKTGRSQALGLMSKPSSTE